MKSIPAALLLCSAIFLITCVASHADPIEITPGENQIGEIAAPNDVMWYSYTTEPDEPMQCIKIDLCDSNFDTVLTVYDLYEGTELFRNDDCCGVQSKLDIANADPNSTYFIKVSGYGTSAGEYTLKLSVSTDCWIPDVNNDNHTNLVEWAKLSEQWEDSIHGKPSLEDADFDNSGVVDDDDLGLLFENWLGVAGCQ